MGLRESQRSHRVGHQGNRAQRHHRYQPWPGVPDPLAGVSAQLDDPGGGCRPPRGRRGSAPMRGLEASPRRSRCTRRRGRPIEGIEAPPPSGLLEPRSHHRELGPPIAPRDMPVGFVWGTATAGFQVDMGYPGVPDPCIDADSDWYGWVTSPVIVEQASLHVTRESLAVGPAMWSLFEEDVARMQGDGMTGYRMSLEYGRRPAGRGCGRPGRGWPGHPSRSRDEHGRLRAGRSQAGT